MVRDGTWVASSFPHGMGSSWARGGVISAEARGGRKAGVGSRGGRADVERRRVPRV